MSDNMMNIMGCVITLLCAIVTYMIVPYIKTKYSSEQLEIANEWVTKAVACAEVLYPEAKSGNVKREYVIDSVYKIVNKNKEIITRDQIRMLLEKAVSELNKEKVK